MGEGMKTLSTKFGFVLLLLVAVGAEARAEASKQAFTLFNPTPRAQLRELSPDRPDVTESPYTVDAGHVQVELSFAEWRKGSGTEELSILPSNVKLGLTNNMDLQFVFEPWLRSQAGGRTDSGHGGTQIRLKLNLFGNDEGAVALGIMPFLQFPTGADAFSNDDHLEGGLILPFAASLPNDWALGAMLEFDIVRDGSGGYDSFLVHTVTIGHDLFGPVGAYLEYVGVMSIDGGRDYEAALGLGFSYSVNSDTLLDAGIYTGLTAAADDLRLFVGVTHRL